MRRLALVLGVLALLASFGIQAKPASAATSPSFVRIIHASPFVGTADVFVDGSMTVEASGHTLVNGISYQNASTYIVIPAGAYTFDVNSPANIATLSTSATLDANKVSSLFVVGMFNGTPKSALVTAQAAGLPGVPNTGSDHNAISHTHTAQSLTPWSWPLGIASLLLIGSGIFLRKVIVRRSERSR